MRLFQKRILKRLNNKGLTMVELICAVAIVSILGTCISGFMIVGANSYRSGSAETQVQQEAQLVANQIDDLIIDSTASVTFSGGVLTITQEDKSQSTVTYSSADKALYYMAYTYNAVTNMPEAVDTNGAQLMAEGVESFSVDTTDFEKTGNIKMEMKVSSGSHVYPAYFTITSRNKALSPEAVTYTKKAKVITNIRKWLLEPNQSYDFSSHASAVDKNGIARDVTWSIATSEIDADTKFVDNGAGKNSKLQIGKDEMKSVIRIKASFTEDGETAERYIDVYIRRVNTINLQGLLMPTTLVSNQYKMGAEYKLGTAFNGTSLNQVSGAAYDTAPYAYVDTRTVAFTVSSGDDTAVEINQPTGMLTLKRDLASGESITIKATSLHAAGTNKSGVPYATVTSEWTLSGSILNLPINWQSSFKRGADSNVAYQGERSDFIKQKLNLDNLPGNLTVSWFARFKEKSPSGEWTTFTKMAQNSFNDFKVNAGETTFFKVDKDYDIQFAVMIYDSSTQKIYWPIDTDLTDGDGKYNGETVDKTGFEDWSIYNPDSKGPTAKGEYSRILTIGAAKYYFDTSNQSSYPGVTFGASAGTVDKPVVIQPGSLTQIVMDKPASVGISYQDQHSITLDVDNLQYWDGTKWIAATQEQKNGITVGTDNLLKIQNLGTVSGIFRGGVYVRNYSYQEYDAENTTVLSGFVGTTGDAKYKEGVAYSYTDGTGVITFKLPEKPKPAVSATMVVCGNQSPNNNKQAYNITFTNEGSVAVPQFTMITFVVKAMTGVTVEGFIENNTEYPAKDLGNNEYELTIPCPAYLQAGGSQTVSDRYFTMTGLPAGFDYYKDQALTIVP